MYTEAHNPHPTRARIATRARVTRERGQRIKRGLRRTLKRQFLRLYREDPHVAHVCEEIGIARGTFYAWLKRDVTFAAEYQAIIDEHSEAMRQELERMYPSRIVEEEYWMHVREGELTRMMKRCDRRAGNVWW